MAILAARKRTPKGGRHNGSCELLLYVVMVVGFAIMPIYVVGIAFFKYSAVANPLAGNRDTVALAFMEQLYAGGPRGTSDIDDLFTRWTDENHTQIEQIPVLKPLGVCKRDAPLGDAASPYKWYACDDGFAHALPSPPDAGSAREADLFKPCVVLSFSLAAAEALDLSFETAAAARGCAVHYFNPRSTSLLSALADGVEVQPGVTLHRYTVAATDVDPAVVFAGRHPDTLREDQTWRRRRLADVIAEFGRTLGIDHVSVVRLDLDGHEWEVVADCVATGKACADRISQLLVQWHLWSPDDRQAGPEIYHLAAWAETLGALEQSAHFRQFRIAPVPPGGLTSGGLVEVGLLPTMHRNHPKLGALFGSLKPHDRRLPCCYRASYVQRPVSKLLSMETEGHIASQAAWLAARKDAFCKEANALARQQYGPDAQLHSGQCATEGGASA